MRRSAAALMMLGTTLACATDSEAPGDDVPTTVVATVLLDLPLGDDDSVLIARLNYATRLPDGRIVALDGDAMALVFFDSTGAVLHRVGREGAGPGEFQYPSWIGRCHSDSLFVWDGRLQRMSVFASSGEYAREFRVPMAQPFTFRCNPSGSIATFEEPATAGGPPVPGANYPILTSRVLVFNAVGDSIGGIADVPIGQERPLGALAAMAVSDSMLLLGINSSPLLTSHTLGGRKLAVESLPLTTRPPTDAEYSAELDRLAARMGGSAEMRARVREMLAVAPKPDIVPLYRALFLSSEEDATRWAVTSLAVDSVTHLLGRAPDGRGYTLILPAGIEPFEFGADFILAKLSDADGMERLVTYRLGRPAD